MRNFEERRAEIFRRSENRIKARKRMKNSVIAVCVPLCLAVTVCSVGLLGQMRHKGAPDVNDENASYELLVESEDFEYVVVTDSDKSTQLKTIENRVKVEKIYTAISNLYSDVSGGAGTLEDYEVNQDHVQSNFKENQKPQDEVRDEVELKGEQTKGDSADESYTAGSSSLKPAYTICFTFADGSFLKYELKNNKLINLNNNSQVQLADEQVKEILQLFELI